MIGKAAWFQRRKYSGWGITPKTWQGWAYAFFIAAPVAIFQALPYWSNEVRVAATGVWVAVVALDVIHIMANMNHDEREYKIDAISERNSAWVMVVVIAMGVAYQAYGNTNGKGAEIDPFLLITLGAGVVAKAISNIYYSRKSL
ncbi:MAG: hypothetical protein WC725_02135 [Patescibacteria group bacterium]|jgi:uncharacterized membrane protein